MKENDNALSALKLLERNRVGAILRVFSAVPETVDYHATSAISTARALSSLRIGGRSVFARIDLLVSSDNEYDDSDCGLMASRLREMIAQDPGSATLNVHEIKKGDIYCMLLNYGIANQLGDRIEYSLILSHNASSSVTQENIQGLLAAMYNKARVAGVAIDEVRDLVKGGFVMNTCAMWHNKSLVTVGGFDLRAGKPHRTRQHEHEKVSSWSKEKEENYGNGNVEYHVAGCEEVIPLLRMVHYFGPCISVIVPQEVGLTSRDLAASGDIGAYHRHLAKLATKEDRMRKMAAFSGLPLSLLEEGKISS